MSLYPPQTQLVSALLAMLATLAVSGCVASKTKSGQGFQESLRACRMAQPGRVNRRINLPAGSPAIARCLERKGWRPDGSKIRIDGSTYNVPIEAGEQFSLSLFVPRLVAVVVP